MMRELAWKHFCMIEITLLFPIAPLCSLWYCLLFYDRLPRTCLLECVICCRVFGHFEKPIFLELCKQCETIRLRAGQFLFTIGKYSPVNIKHSLSNARLTQYNSILPKPRYVFLCLSIPSVTWGVRVSLSISSQHHNNLPLHPPGDNNGNVTITPVPPSPRPARRQRRERVRRAVGSAGRVHHRARRQRQHSEVRRSWRLGHITAQLL